MANALDVQVAGEHYKGMVIQPIEFCQKNELNAAETHAIGYICRHRKKNGAEDIRKAIHMLELLLEIEYGEEADTEEAKPYSQGVVIDNGLSFSRYQDSHCYQDWLNAEAQEE